MGTLGDEGIQPLVDNAARFKHLKLLDVQDNYLTNKSLKLLRPICANVVFGEQRDDEGDPNDRYASAIE